MSQEMDLMDVIEKLLGLRRWADKAPHQPCFLLAIADLIESGDLLESNQLDIDNPTFVVSFNRYFDAVKHNKDRFKPDRSKPLVALHKREVVHCKFNDEHLAEVEKFVDKVNPSLYQIRKTVIQTTISSDVRKWLLDEVGRQQIRTAIIERYFPDRESKLRTIIERGLLTKLQTANLRHKMSHEVGEYCFCTDLR